MKGYGYQFTIAPRINVNASQHTGNRQRPSHHPRRSELAGAEHQPSRHCQDGHDRVDQLVAELVPALEVEQVPQRDVIDDPGDRDRNDPCQPGGRRRRCPSGSASRRGAGRRHPDDQVGLDREEGESVECPFGGVRKWPVPLLAAVKTLMRTPASHAKRPSHRTMSATTWRAHRSSPEFARRSPVLTRCR